MARNSSALHRPSAHWLPGLHSHPSIPLLFLLLPLLLLLLCGPAQGLVFTLEEKECFVQHIPKEQYNAVSFVVVNSQWGWSHDTPKLTISLKVSDPQGTEVLQVSEKTEEESFFYTQNEGDYKICFQNKVQHSWATVALHISSYTDWLNKKSTAAKGEEMDSVHMEVERLTGDVTVLLHEVSYSISLASQHIEMYTSLSKRVVYKAVTQALLLLLCSAAQILLLQWLVEKRVNRKSKV